MVKSSSIYPQRSDWSTSPNSVSHNQSTLNIDRQNNTKSNSIPNENSTNDDKQKYHSLLKFRRCCSSIPASLRGLLLALLIGSLVLSAIIPLWLTSTHKTTITTTNTFTETTTVFSTAVNSSSSTITTTTTTTDTSSSSTTTTVSVSSTTASGSCNVSNTTVLYYRTNPTVYTLETYNYTASSSGIGAVSFSFYSQTGSYYWHLDNISVIDTNAYNSEMLTNGDFENGTLAGWQQLCTQNCSSSSGILTNSTCLGGSYCYKDACRYGYDYLQQTFPVTSGHIYTLSFWLCSDGGPFQQAFIGIS